MARIKPLLGLHRPASTGLAVLLFFGAALAGLLGFQGARGAEQAKVGAIHVITVQQAIGPSTGGYIRRALENAAFSRAEILIIELDTPGGLLDSTREIVQSILSAPLPVVVYIAPAGARGASAGTMITLASHVAAMAPATHIGAAHPVSLFGGGDDKVMAEKILNDTSAFVESIAELRGRNVEWAISSVRDSTSITARKALELKVIELIADDLTDLVAQLDGREVRMSRTETRVIHTAGRPVQVMDISFSQGLLAMLSNPNLVFVFLILGLVGLYIEFSNPGLYLPGILGAVSLILALIALQTLPVSYGALGLIVLGAALLLAEAFVPSFGILGIGGLGAMLLGSIFLLDESRTDLRVSLPVILSAVGTVGVVALVMGRLIFRSFRIPPRSFQSNLAGQIAEVRERIRPGGTGLVFVNGELWKAVAEEPIARGAKVSVRKADGLVLTVLPAPHEETKENADESQKKPEQASAAEPAREPGEKHRVHLNGE